MRSLFHIVVLAGTLLAADPAGADGDEPLSAEETRKAVAVTGVMLGLAGGPVQRCDPTYEAAAIKAVEAALADRPDLWRGFLRSREFSLSKVAPKVAEMRPEDIDCAHYRAGVKHALAGFLEQVPRFR